MKKPKYLKVVFYLHDIINTAMSEIIGNGFEYTNDNYESLILTKKEISKIKRAFEGYYD